MMFMPKAKDTDLFKAIKTYITVYLPVIRRKSNNTVEAARYGLNLFFDYLSDAKNLGMSDVTASDFSAENIAGFLSWLQTVRQNEVTPVNQRLSQIRSFCKYLMKNDILYADEMNRIADIAMIKDTRKDNFEYLSADEVKNLLNLPDKNTKIGIRDCFYMALLYDSGARNQELLDLCVRDFVYFANYIATLCFWLNYLQFCHRISVKADCKAVPFSLDGNSMIKYHQLSQEKSLLFLSHFIWQFTFNALPL